MKGSSMGERADRFPDHIEKRISTMANAARVAWVTGGGTAIGAAAAKGFAAQGTAVALVGRRPDIPTSSGA